MNSVLIYLAITSLLCLVAMTASLIKYIRDGEKEQMQEQPEPPADIIEAEVVDSPALIAYRTLHTSDGTVLRCFPENDMIEFCESQAEFNRKNALLVVM